MNKPKIIQIIDVVSNAIAGNRIDEDFIKSCIYGKVDAELYAHLLGKYRGYDGDFFQFYLGTDDRINRALLENLGIKFTHMRHIKSALVPQNRRQFCKFIGIRIAARRINQTAGHCECAIP